LTAEEAGGNGERSAEHRHGEPQHPAR